MTFDEALLAAIAYRRCHMTWREIGHKVGFDKDRLREAATAAGYRDGWGDGSMIRSAGTGQNGFAACSSSGGDKGNQ